MNVIAIAYIGRWIGNRCPPLHGLAAAIGSIVVGHSANILLTFGLLRLFSGWFGSEIVEAYTSNMTIMGLMPAFFIIVFYIIIISLGVWWGNRGRLARYFVFILKVLPQETRQTIVEIARDEAVRASMSMSASST